MNFENDDTYKMLVTERKRVELLSDAAFEKAAEAALRQARRDVTTLSGYFPARIA